jgi:hypothetical protein
LLLGGEAAVLASRPVRRLGLGYLFNLRQPSRKTYANINDLSDDVLAPGQKRCLTPYSVAKLCTLLETPSFLSALIARMLCKRLNIQPTAEVAKLPRIHNFSCSDIHDYVFFLQKHTKPAASWPIRCGGNVTI